MKIAQLLQHLVWVDVPKMDTVMHKFCAPGTSAAFRSASGGFIFTSDTFGKWQLLRSVSSANDYENRGTSNSVEYYHFMIDCKAAYMTPVDKTTILGKPSIITIIQGISSEFRSTWTEHHVRRYALLSKLFGEASAQTGDRYLLLTIYIWWLLHQIFLQRLLYTIIIMSRLRYQWPHHIPVMTGGMKCITVIYISFLPQV